MLDYCAWIDRAKAFLKTVAHLPGSVVVSNSIETPEDSDYFRESIEELRGYLPEPIHRFVSEASSRCAFSYDWTPLPPLCARLQQFYPMLESLKGGGDLCEHAAYSNYANRDRLEEILPGVGAMLNFKPPFLGGLVWLARANGTEERDIVLDYRRDASGAVVIESGVDWSNLSDSFDQFLLDWEAIRYVRLTPKMLAPWLDAETRMLRPDRALAAQWQTFLEEAAGGM